MVDVEWPQDLTDKRHGAYLSGTLAVSRNEVVQLGFRLAKTMHLSRVNGIDVDGEFPYPPVEAYAKAHGTMPLLKLADAEIAAQTTVLDDVLSYGTIGTILLLINAPPIGKSQQFLSHNVQDRRGRHLAGCGVADRLVQAQLLYLRSSSSGDCTGRPGGRVLRLRASASVAAMRERNARLQPRRSERLPAQMKAA
jgi:hypothetical protein